MVNEAIANNASTSHVLPEVENLLSLNRQERIAHIQKDSWIGYTKAKEALIKLEELIHYPQRHRMPNLLIVSPTNNGKTMIIEKFKRHYPIKRKTERSYFYSYRFNCTTDEYLERELIEEVPVAFMQMPTSPDLRRFYLNLMYHMEATFAEAMYSGPLEISTLKLLERFKTRMLIIDEIHNILAGSANKQREFLNLLRYLGNNLRIPIVCVGTRDAYLAIRSDPQLENRFEPFPLPTWQAGREYDSLLASIVKLLPLKEPSDLNDPTIANLILQKSEGTIGEIMTLVKQAAILALQLGVEKIDESIIRGVKYQSPSERRAVFEKTL